MMRKQYDSALNGDAVQANLLLQYYGGHVVLTARFSQISFDNIKIEALTPPAPPVPAAAATVESASAATNSERFSNSLISRV